MHRRAFIISSIGAGLTAATGLAACSSTSSTPTSSASGGSSGAVSAASKGTAITEVFGDGQKVVAVALQYPKEIDAAKLTTSSFTVADRTITKVYANTAPTLADQGVNGTYVVVEMSPDDAAAALKPAAPTGGGTGGGPSGAPSGGPGGGSGGQPSGGGTGAPPQNGPSQAMKAAVATVVQAGTVTAVDGATFAASSTGVTTTAVSNLVVDDFKQLEFADPKTGQTVKYNLFTPKDYDKTKSYPLVLFMHDSSVLSTVTTTTLTQGNGATCWASPADQAKRAAFVLAPQYSTITVDDRSGYTISKQVEATVNLVEEVTTQYSIDKSRLYTTGQSMGALMSIVMDIEHPDLFAASYIVAGQWDATKVSPMADDKLWIVVSQGDTNAYRGENAITAALEKDGAKVSRAVWDGTSTAAQFATDVQQMAAKNTSVNYAALKTGTVVLKGEDDSSINNHLNTWRIAYSIDGIRDWVFEQHT